MTDGPTAEEWEKMCKEAETMLEQIQLVLANLDRPDISGQFAYRFLAYKIKKILTP